ncbi:MAG: putative bifunctional diguanylate cyclase/phosphodiesterase, partial [Janthinobacterium lividum]
DAASVRRTLARIPLGAGAASFECRLPNAAGEFRWLQWKATRCGEELFLIGRDLTERKEAEQAVSDAYQKLTFYMMNSPLAFVEWNRELRVGYWSPEAEQVFGWPAEEVLDRHPSEWAFVQEADAAVFLKTIVDLVRDGRDKDRSLSWHYRPDGSPVLCEWYHSTLRDEDGSTLSVFSLALDVTERKRAEGELLMIRKAVESASEAICIADLMGTAVYLNQAFTELFGYSLDQINSEGIDTLLVGASAREESVAAIENGFSWKGETEVTSRTGQVLPITMHADAIKDENGKRIGRITVYTDMRERKQAEKERIYQTLHDPLTGLPNRIYFGQRVDRALARSKRTGALLACLFIDLDNVKAVNDSLGHEAGDELLKMVGERLQAAVRPEDMVARLDGDEFVILIEGITDYKKAFWATGRAAVRIAAHLKKAMVLSGRELTLTASIGIATNGEPLESAALESAKRESAKNILVQDLTAEDLLRNANAAMCQAKANGKAKYIVFDPRMNIEAMDRLEIEMDLRRALERGEMEVYFQPIIHLESGRLAEAEALLRWRHPTRGLVGPVQFIPIAEETGLIVPLGEWVLEQSCLQAQDWQERYPSEPPLTISVNLSIRQLQQADIVDRVRRVLERTGLRPSCLKLEITEGVMMDDAEAAAGKLRSLKALGIHLAVDDFGTGYSSMAYLSRFPVDTLKIDRAFVQKVGDVDGLAIIHAIVDLAKSLKLSITSEGIETEEQRESLRVLGSDRGQGYLFAKPLPRSAFEALLAQERSSRDEKQPDLESVPNHALLL